MINEKIEHLNFALSAYHTYPDLTLKGFNNEPMYFSNRVDNLTGVELGYTNHNDKPILFIKLFSIFNNQKIYYDKVIKINSFCTAKYSIRQYLLKLGFTETIVEKVEEEIKKLALCN